MIKRRGHLETVSRRALPFRTSQQMVVVMEYALLTGPLVMVVWRRHGRGTSLKS
jgi:hypothetical protein